MKAFFEKYKVFILGLLGSITIAIQSLMANNPAETDTKVYLFAGLIAVLSFVANEWRGKGVTLIGVIGTLAGVFVTQWQTGKFSWVQFILFGVVAILAAAAPPPKPASYEQK